LLIVEKFLDFPLRDNDPARARKLRHGINDFLAPSLRDSVTKF
jgi:hypothetical protein